VTRVVAVIQARMGSQRFPGKVLEPLADAAVIDWVVHRVRRATSIDEALVATSTETADDPLVEHCRSHGYAATRGSLNDVLDRVHSSAEGAAADHIVRVTADCPLIDPTVIDDVVTIHLARHLDFTATQLPSPHKRTYPIGLDVEVATAAALSDAWRHAKSPHQREHVMPYLYEEQGRFDLHVVESRVDAGDVRWSIDTPEDLAAVNALVLAADAGFDTPWLELLEVWRASPHIRAVNAAVGQRHFTDTDPRV
jgi:spore coat polysaccharide biosynthesis protein SpsF